MTVFVNGALERAVLYAEECVAREERKQALDMVGVPASASASEEGERKLAVTVG